MRQKLKAGFVFSLMFVLTVSAAQAGVLDSVPILKNIPSATKTHFFCPLIKDFYNDRDKTAVETILLESLGEGYMGMVAVGEVIRNREKLFKKKSETVCLMPKQFSCWNDKQKAREFLKKNRLYYFVAYTAWLASKASSLTRGATDYHATSVTPYWAEVYRISVRIGNHYFYTRK